MVSPIYFRMPSSIQRTTNSMPKNAIQFMLDSYVTPAHTESKAGMAEQQEGNGVGAGWDSTCTDWQFSLRTDLVPTAVIPHTCPSS